MTTVSPSSSMSQSKPRQESVHAYTVQQSRDETHTERNTPSVSFPRQIRASSLARKSCRHGGLFFSAGVSGVCVFDGSRTTPMSMFPLEGLFTPIDRVAGSCRHRDTRHPPPPGLRSPAPRCALVPERGELHAHSDSEISPSITSSESDLAGRATVKKRSTVQYGAASHGRHRMQPGCGPRMRSRSPLLLARCAWKAAAHASPRTWPR